MLTHYIARAHADFPPLRQVDRPWHAPARLADWLRTLLPTLSDDYQLTDGVAIHRRATVEAGAVLKPPAVVSVGCFVAAHAYLRGGTWLGENVTVGPGCEVKASVIFSGSTLAHFNFVGDALVGAGVNLEAGAVLANHYNERADPQIWVRLNGQLVPTGVTKFGALLGDGCRLGANAVTSPGTLLPPGSVVGRLTLVNQAGE